ncbi:cytochrome ubiquinol oxidase subunit I [Halalkalibacter akibai]|uniref:Cytochrome d ubiquinol oxidase subunit I n=1 Tax=Halalkalibacter akibai (strain ATCC 43226 / DSM 21942 / CIP 109018 / JCM 9157 / 1139) TaxID=1236973 RepID=W4QYY0_HALA3|nr:cytochrome ubiquinol oxidase subunit I [Halalkalibacter akibai]GAE37112.1 cytochrome d ubiquinol oxidase subunit I [Halalkalibacter akibai JCM 9157]
MESVEFSRYLTMLTLSVHVIYATLGVGVPIMIALAHWLGLKRKDEHYLLLAKRWARGYVITVAVGVVTGTAIALQLALLWPRFMEFAGQLVALPLFMETFAFFFEAIFLGIYLYTWDRFKNPMRHFYLLIPVVLGSAMSALFITSVNAFMNTPQGFTLVDGQLTNIQPLLAMFNPAMPTKVAHVLTSAYMTTAFVLAAIAAYHLMKGNKHAYHRKALALTMKVALIFSIATALVGDLSGKFLAEYQPEKLAAAEWHFETEGEAPLMLYGILTETNEVKYAIKIPYALSILVHSNPTGVVTGLNDIPEEYHPPYVIHYFFDIMVTIGIWLTFLSLVYWIALSRNWAFIQTRLFRFLLVTSGPLAMIAIEAGWWFTEVGRQPWIMRDFMKTAEGATNSPYVGWMFVAFAILYVILLIGTVVVLTRMFKNNPAERELERMETEQRSVAK